MGTYNVGDKLLYFGCGPNQRRGERANGMRCEIIEVLEDGRFVVLRMGRRNKVSAKTLDREYTFDLLRHSSPAG
jgi:hypothetical protein